MRQYEEGLTVTDVSSLVAYQDNSVTHISLSSMRDRDTSKINFAEIYRVLAYNGTLAIHAYLAPNKRKRAQFVVALHSIIFGRVVEMLNEYEWERLLKGFGFKVAEKWKRVDSVELASLTINHEHRQIATILLIQCPSDLQEFLNPNLEEGAFNFHLLQLLLVKE